MRVLLGGGYEIPPIAGQIRGFNAVGGVMALIRIGVGEVPSEAKCPV